MRQTKSEGDVLCLLSSTLVAVFHAFTEGCAFPAQACRRVGCASYPDTPHDCPNHAPTRCCYADEKARAKKARTGQQRGLAHWQGMELKQDHPAWPAIAEAARPVHELFAASSRGGPTLWTNKLGRERAVELPDLLGALPCSQPVVAPTPALACPLPTHDLDQMIEQMTKQVEAEVAWATTSQGQELLEGLPPVIVGRQPHPCLEPPLAAAHAQVAMAVTHTNGCTPYDGLTTEDALAEIERITGESFDNPAEAAQYIDAMVQETRKLEAAGRALKRQRTTGGHA